MSRARHIAQDREQMTVLLEKVHKKAGQNGVSSLWEEVKLFTRMLKAHFNGSYRGISSFTVLMLVFGLVYFLMPLDVIPDVLPALGFTDDLAVLVMILRRFSADIAAFKSWEENQCRE
jgi:uncharacterized membrane protein YkvA (DUF1232 family)